ncbi:MAG: AI-2E family transporter [Acidimicrobiales bacterium]
MEADATSPVPAEPRDPMPQWVPRAIGLMFLGVIALWLLRGLFQDLSGFLVTLLISFFFSFALEPAVNWLERIGFRRGVGTLIMFALAITLIAVFGWIVGSVLAEQTIEFVDDAPNLIDESEAWLQRNIDESIELNRLRDQFLETDGLGDQLTGLANNVVGLGATVVSLVFQIFTIVLFTFYLTADGPKLRRTICSRLKPDRQRRVLGVWDLAIQKTGGYILSRTVLATISAIVTWIAFSIIGVEFPLALAVWVGVVSQFVPVVGVYIAGALPVGLTLLSSPSKALWALVFMVCYQQFENYLLAPRIDSRTLKIHPAVAFGSVVAGASILGPVGAVLAMPAAATAQGIISASGERYAIEEGPLTALATHPAHTRRDAPVVPQTLPVHRIGDEVEMDSPAEDLVDESVELDEPFDPDDD